MKTLGILPIAPERVLLTAEDTPPSSREMQEAFTLIEEYITLVARALGTMRDEAYQAMVEGPTRALCFAGIANDTILLLETALRCTAMTARYYAPKRDDD